MALYEIPTGRLPYEVVDKLPAQGEENKIYGVPIEGVDGIYTDYRWHNGAWEEVDLGSTIFGFLFNDYQEAVNKTISDLEQRVENLEGKGKVLFEGSNIELTESGATIGERIAVATNIEVTDGTVFHCTLTDMTIDGQPIEDANGDITAYQVPGWDWQGGELYDVPFGNSAYFAFGTEPKDAVATKVTLGFVNENGEFDVRTLVIGHIKVEVISLAPQKGGKK